jgi:hypothetical protein
MNLLNDLIINSVKWLRILSQFVQNVKVLRLPLEKERHQSIDVTTVATNFMTLKPGLSIQPINKKVTMVDDTQILTNKIIMCLFILRWMGDNSVKKCCG